MRYLAIDYGTKQTGLAVCDRNETVVSPLAVLPTRDNLLKRITEIIKQENIEAIVVGLPLNMDGTQGPQARRTIQFAEALKKQSNIAVHLQDERLSSFAAEDRLAASPLAKKKKREMLDALAAAEILQAFLDSKREK